MGRKMRDQRVDAKSWRQVLEWVAVNPKYEVFGEPYEVEDVSKMELTHFIYVGAREEMWVSLSVEMELIAAALEHGNVATQDMIRESMDMTLCGLSDEDRAKLDKVVAEARELGTCH